MGEGFSKLGGHYERLWTSGVEIENDTDGEDEYCPKWKGRPDKTVIIFDWDDTLLCSSAINLGEWTGVQLEELADTVQELLTISMALGETLIITNGNEGWVQDSTRMFLPRLMPLVAQLKVMSARASYESLYPGEPFAWKRLAFKEFILHRQAREGTREAQSVNLLVLGDSRAEIEAADSVFPLLGLRSLLKTVKFKEMPTIHELLGQLRKVLEDLSSLVLEEQSLSRGLSPRAFQGSIAASGASGWTLSRQRRPITSRSFLPCNLTVRA
eukprot:TRINITY_DN6646_c0_g1_i1.p1 TRINITY_DN6646_c0_g1~~TRINITY_DN6646_c0_g1_i1.p1  ORF type:complete len:281 (+),score=49.52 TRINITY_DN6646_c0_g1_i1:34-843(+)